MSVTMDASQFRERFPEFWDAGAFPEPSVVMWIDLAKKLLNPDRWGDVIDHGAGLFVAHNLALGAMDDRAVASGGIPGQAASGIVASKSVDKVSVSYDTTGAAEAGAGHWNLTTYGTRYIRLARMMGAGPLQVGTGPFPSTSVVSGAWPGPGVW